MRYGKILLSVLLFVLFCTIPGSASTTIHGEILEVFFEQNKVRVLVNGKMDILLLDEQVKVFRNGRTVQVQSARPIKEGKYQEGLFFINKAGLIEVIVVDYSVEERRTDSGSEMIYYDIFGNVKEVEQLFSSLKEFAY